MPTKTKEDIELERKEALEEYAKLLKDLEPVFDVQNGFTTVRDRVKAPAEMVEPFKGFDVKEVSQALERLKASHEQLAKSIRTSTKVGYVSGMEDEEFNCIKYILGCRIGHKEAGSEKEFDLTKQAHAAIE